MNKEERTSLISALVDSWQKKVLQKLLDKMVNPPVICDVQQSAQEQRGRSEAQQAAESLDQRDAEDKTMIEGMQQKIAETYFYPLPTDWYEKMADKYDYLGIFPMDQFGEEPADAYASHGDTIGVNDPTPVKANEAFPATGLKMPQIGGMPRWERD